jgi:hypothetical protein
VVTIPSGHAGSVPTNLSFRPSYWSNQSTKDGIIFFQYFLISDFNNCNDKFVTASASSGQSSCLQIQRSGFDSWSYQIFWEAVGLERGPLSVVSKIEELLGRKSRGSGPENREYGRRDPSCWPRGTFYTQRLPLTSPKRGGRSVGIVRSRMIILRFFNSTLLLSASCPLDTFSVVMK